MVLGGVAQAPTLVTPLVRSAVAVLERSGFEGPSGGIDPALHLADHSLVDLRGVAVIQRHCDILNSCDVLNPQLRHVPRRVDDEYPFTQRHSALVQ